MGVSGTGHRGTGGRREGPRGGPCVLDDTPKVPGEESYGAIFETREAGVGSLPRKTPDTHPSLHYHLGLRDR